jgi:hypothetical protein
MSKVKMRCTTCGKWFQSANVKEVTCPDCVQKAKKDKLATKNLPATQKKVTGTGNSTTTNTPRVVAPPPKPKQPIQSGTNQWLDKLEDVKVGQPEEPPIRHKVSSPPVQRDQRPGQGTMRPNGDSNHQNARTIPYGGKTSPPQWNEQGRPDRGPGSYRSGSGFGSRPRPTAEGVSGRGPRGEQKHGLAGGKGTPPQGGIRERGKAQPPRAALSKPLREKIPPPPPFVPTEEQIKQAEARYLELAQPAEFDGIRTQIAHELGIPKKAIKKIIKDLRQQSQIPSWWELQVYKGSKEELEKIQELYMPYLPLPPIGVHKQIATQLDIKPSVTYQAIKAIRQELNLPQYNDPTLHEGFVYMRTNKPTTVNESVTNEPTTVNELAANEPATINELVANEPEAVKEPVTEAAQSEQ